LKALSYNPKDRQKSATELGEQLAQALNASGSHRKWHSATSIRSLLTRRRIIGGLAVVSALAAAAEIGPSILRQREKTPPDERMLSYYILVQQSRNGRPFQ